MIVIPTLVEPKYDHSNTQLNWEGEVPPDSIISIVREYIKNDLARLSKPSDLYYHIIPLSYNYDGPCVILYGQDDNTFRAVFFVTPKWSTDNSDDFNDD